MKKRYMLRDISVITAPRFCLILLDHNSSEKTYRPCIDSFNLQTHFPYRYCILIYVITARVRAEVPPLLSVCLLFLLQA